MRGAEANHSPGRRDRAMGAMEGQFLVLACGCGIHDQGRGAREHCPGP